MSWHYLPELVGESSDPTYPTSERSRRSRSSLTAEKSCCVAKETACYPCSRSGMTSEHSMGDHGVESWISSLLASRVSRSPRQAQDEPTRTNETYGRKPCESFAKWDPISSSWKTFQGSSLTHTSEPYSKSWPRAGMIRDGIAYRLRPSAPITREIAYGLHVAEYPTPSRTAYGSSGNGTGNNVASRGRPSLETMARTGRWPIPTVGDAKSSGSRNLPGSKANAGVSLTDAVKHGNSNTPRDKRDGGKLNPTWVEWLMGWPLGWTALEPLETVKFQQWYESFSGGDQ